MRRTIGNGDFINDIFTYTTHVETVCLLERK